jgi:hypothetical protein
MTKRTVLYYPTINIPSNKWLKTSLLYWDEVSSIVPQTWDNNYLYNLSADIHYLIDEGEFRAIKPEELIYRPNNAGEYEMFRDEFKSVIQSKEFTKLVPSKAKSETKRQYWEKYGFKIHSNKTSDEIFEFLIEVGLANRKSAGSEWLIFEKHCGLVYMSLLAKYLAEVDDSHTTVSTDKKIYEGFNFKKKNEGEGGAHVLNLNIINLIPAPLPDTPLSKIVDFKKKRKHELLHFRKKLFDLEKEIAKSQSNNEIRHAITSFNEEIETGIKDLTAMMRDSKIDVLFKSFKALINLKSSSVLTAVAEIANEKLNILDTTISTNVITLATVGVIEITGNYIELKNKALAKTRESAFSYLLYARKAQLIK